MYNTAVTNKLVRKISLDILAGGKMSIITLTLILPSFAIIPAGILFRYTEEGGCRYQLGIHCVIEGGSPQTQQV